MRRYKLPRQREIKKILKTGNWYVRMNLKGAHMYASEGFSACGVPLQENTESMEIAAKYPEEKKCPDCLYHEQIGK